jgi:glucosylceramidase
VQVINKEAIKMIHILFVICVLFSNSLFAKAGDPLSFKAYSVSLEQGEEQPLKEIEQKNITEKNEWENRIYVQPNITFQEIEGIGGAFNEIGGEALMSLGSQQKQSLLKNLFVASNAGFSFCRTAIGASDFGINAYSYSEVPEDFSLSHFSIERDKQYVLPFIQSALAINPNLRLFASPWSPPAWMKQNNSMTGLTELPNRLREEKRIYKSYANYFVKYLQGYKENDVPIERICIQNENDADAKYPSNIFPAKKMVEFATSYLKPAFSKHGITTKIYAGTFRAVDQLDMLEFLMTKGYSQLEGIGVQYTSTTAIADARNINPTIKLFHTEGDCFNGDNSFEQANKRLAEVASYINSGATTYTYWNMILNETTQSGWGWAQNSLIVIDRTKKTIQYNPDYNALYIISHFIKPGDVRIGSVVRGKYPLITVKDKIGNIKVLIQNTHSEAKMFEVVIDTRRILLNLPGNAISAILLDKPD